MGSVSATGAMTVTYFFILRATLVNSTFLVPTNPKNRVGRSEIKKNQKIKKIIPGQKESIIIALQI